MPNRIVPDIVFSPNNSSQMTVYVSTGQRHATLLPAYASSANISRPSDSGWTVRVVDLDADGVQDVVAAGGFPAAESGAASSTAFLRNTNPQGWPLSMQNQGNLSLAGYEPDFLDLDGDTRPDAVALVTDPADPGLSGYTVAWQRNLGGTPPQFGPEQPLAEVNAQIFRPVGVAAVNEGPERGLLVEHHNWQRVAFFRSPAAPTESSRLEYVGEAGSVAAPMSLSDQAWPYPCDWDGDGDWDLLVGGGYGWPQIVINEGTNAQPAFAKSQLIYADGQPIRLLRNLILGQPFHWHNMGYPYPVYADWDTDGLPDLVLPNETNRIFWYRNVGTRSAPQFGPQQQILVDGYPDSPALRQLSAERALSATYPKEQEQPFFWRTGAAVADFNGDGLTDLATHDGYTRNLTLFARYRGDNNELRLRKEGPLTVTDGRPINESIVGRSSGWTESFDAIDWNGDGLMDVVYSLSGKSGDTVYLLRNVGTMPSPVFALPEPIRPFGQPINITAHGPHVGVADLDGDERPEVIGCTEWSVYAFYRGTALAMAQRPGYQLGSVYSPTAGADFDFDEDVDQDDFGHFQLCLTGPYLGPPVAGCEGTDLDGDGDVDAEDASVFLQCLSGANVPADPHCTD